jgi:thiamine-monophosphate kinase
MISITAVGEVSEGEILYRSGAAPGDIAYVTGTLGDSAAGVKILRGEISVSEALASPLKRAHFLPEPRLAVGREAARSHLASAMIDLSDGLVSDLGHICDASGVGARIHSASLPLSPELHELAAEAGLDPLPLALSGGEDYELLITVPRQHSNRFENRFRKMEDVSLFPIGEITEEKTIRIHHPDGTETSPPAGGFDHFARPQV